MPISHGSSRLLSLDDALQVEDDAPDTVDILTLASSQAKVLKIFAQHGLTDQETRMRVDVDASGRQLTRRASTNLMFTWTGDDTEERDAPRARNWLVDQLRRTAKDGDVDAYATPRHLYADDTATVNESELVNGMVVRIVDEPELLDTLLADRDVRGKPFILIERGCVSTTQAVIMQLKTDVEMVKHVAEFRYAIKLELLSRSQTSSLPMVAVLTDLREYWEFMHFDSEASAIVSEQWGYKGMDRLRAILSDVEKVLRAAKENVRVLKDREFAVPRRRLFNLPVLHWPTGVIYIDDDGDFNGDTDVGRLCDVADVELGDWSSPEPKRGSGSIPGW